MSIKLLTKLIFYDRNNFNFLINALIAYILYNRARDVALYHKFNNTAKCFLAIEEFPYKFTREEI